MSIAAHELKTPITTLRGFAQGLTRRYDKRGTIDPETLKLALSTIDTQSNKLTRLINQLLDVSRLGFGRLALEQTSIDIVAVVQDAVSAIQRNTQNHTITVNPSSSVNVVADPLRLEQVLVNLLDNAVKYSPDGGLIEVDLSVVDEKQLRISITDHGIGIPEDRRKHIFERFYQAHGDGYFGGMGLGLYISQQIMDLHGGQLMVEFPLAGGTRFIMVLPCNL